MFVDQVFRMLEARSALDAPHRCAPDPRGNAGDDQESAGRARRPRPQLARRGRGHWPRVHAPAVGGGLRTRRGCPARTSRRRARERNRGRAGVGILRVRSRALSRGSLPRSPGRRAREAPRSRSGALEASGAPEKALGEIAQHLLAAVTVVGPARALEGSIHAGQRALDALAFEDAATILSTALTKVALSPRARTFARPGVGPAGRGTSARRAHDGARKLAKRPRSSRADLAIRSSRRGCPRVRGRDLSGGHQLLRWSDCSRRRTGPCPRSHAAARARCSPALPPLFNRRRILTSPWCLRAKR